MPNVLVQTVQGTRAILKGMGVVFQNLFRQPFTIEYPEVRRPAPPRTRNRLAFLFDDESEKMRCIGCTSCVVVCPREIIHLKVETVDKKKVVVQFDVDLGDCIGCGNCVEICPVDALELLPDFELAAERKEDLLYDMHKMGKFVQKGYLPAQFYPAKSEPPKPISKNAAPKPIAPPADGTAVVTAVDPATLSPEDQKAAAWIRTEELKAAREAAKATAEAGGATTEPAVGTAEPIELTPEEIKEAGRRKAAELKAAREAIKAEAVEAEAAKAAGPTAGTSEAPAPYKTDAAAPPSDIHPDPSPGG
ncbi:MAG: NADH-quinone oxidoreductase subunit I [Candidatus Sericytochromatia bacterium]|nr:NADH-quinone oxidoreductase subunit I [Candidatus Sericytochromatia bacterium]